MSNLQQKMHQKSLPQVPIHSQQKIFLINLRMNAACKKEHFYVPLKLKT